MRKFFWLFSILCLTGNLLVAQHFIIPLPVHCIETGGVVQIQKSTGIVVSADTLLPEANYLKSMLKETFGIKSTIGKTRKGKAIELKTTTGLFSKTGEYKLEVKETAVLIQSSTRLGIFYGIQSLLQMTRQQGSGSIEITKAEISDYPRFSWRGMHLDVCRHFFSADEVKKYLDILARYKFNVFHWHLTEDQGWRIAIEKYPLLEKIASTRKETVIGKPSEKAKYDGIPHAGFFTQKQVKEIVAYAAERHITIVPEIEMPGHSLAALSAYPNLSCVGGPFEAATTWGVFDDVYCAGNDSALIFLQDVLTEVCALFPGKYIHIGGDECPKERWKNCVRCQDRIKKNGLKDEHELQSWFINQMVRFLETKGKSAIGWDEIMEGGLPPGAAVMSWRGTQGGLEAARANQPVVMSPGKPLYFDHYQSKPISDEPLAIGGFNPVDSVYNYEPVPNNLEPKLHPFILGAQANVWTEYITTFSHVEYMVLPRMMALSEVLWTPKESKNLNDFKIRLLAHEPWLKKQNLNYAKHFFQPLSK